MAEEPVPANLQQPGVQETLAALERAAPFLSLVGVMSDGLTDSMVERTVGNLTRASLLLDRLTSPGMERLIAKLADPQVTEGLGAVLDRAEQVQGLVAALGVFGDSFTDSMVERTVGNLTRASLLLDRLTSPGMERLIAKLADPQVTEGLGAVLDRAEQVQGLVAALGAFSDGLTDTMVERTVGNLTRVTMVLDRLTAPDGEVLIERLLEAGPALGAVLERLSDLERSGRLQRLLELLDMVGVLLDAMTEPMLERMIAFLSGLMEMASDSGGLTSQLRRISQDAVAEARQDDRPMGLLALLGNLKNPEVQQGLKVALALTKRAPQVFGGS